MIVVLLVCPRSPSVGTDAAVTCIFGGRADNRVYALSQSSLRGTLDQHALSLTRKNKYAAIMTSVPASDADAAQLARNTLFTTDEIDLHSAEQGVQAAPDPTADDLRYTDVDVTTSGPLGLHIGPSDVTEPSSSERDAVEGVDASSSGGVSCNIEAVHSQATDALLRRCT